MASINLEEITIQVRIPKAFKIRAKAAIAFMLFAAKIAPFNIQIGTDSHAALDVLAERQRQIDDEGWLAMSDDGMINGELAMAAAAYADHSARARLLFPENYKQVAPHSGLWPFSMDWWKPKDRRRDLVRAGALILAEIERLDRAKS